MPLPSGFVLDQGDSQPQSGGGTPPKGFVLDKPEKANLPNGFVLDSEGGAQNLGMTGREQANTEPVGLLSLGGELVRRTANIPSGLLYNKEQFPPGSSLLPAEGVKSLFKDVQTAALPYYAIGEKLLGRFFPEPERPPGEQPSRVAQAVGGVGSGLAKGIEQIGTPENAAIGAAAALIPVTGGATAPEVSAALMSYFLPQILGQSAPEVMGRGSVTLQDPNATIGEKGSAIGEYLSQGLMAAGLVETAGEGPIKPPGPLPTENPSGAAALLERQNLNIIPPTATRANRFAPYENAIQLENAPSMSPDIQGPPSPITLGPLNIPRQPFPETPPLIGQRPLTIQQPILPPVESAPPSEVVAPSLPPAPKAEPLAGQISFEGQGIPSAGQAKVMTPENLIKSEDQLSGKKLYSGLGDYEQYQDLAKKITELIRGGNLDKVYELQKGTEEIKNRQPIQGTTPFKPGEGINTLRPAVNINGRLAVGKAGDTHADILIRNGINPDTIPHEDPRRGFVSTSYPDRFLNRKIAEQIAEKKGTAKAGGLDSQDLPGAQIKEQPNAIRELRTDRVSETQPSGGLQEMGEEIRQGTDEEGQARGGQGEAQVQGQEGAQEGYYSGLGSIDPEEIRKAAKAGRNFAVSPDLGQGVPRFVYRITKGGDAEEITDQYQLAKAIDEIGDKSYWIDSKGKVIEGKLPDTTHYLSAKKILGEEVKDPEASDMRETYKKMRGQGYALVLDQEKNIFIRGKADSVHIEAAKELAKKEGKTLWMGEEKLYDPSEKPKTYGDEEEEFYGSEPDDRDDPGDAFYSGLGMNFSKAEKRLAKEIAERFRGIIDKLYSTFPSKLTEETKKYVEDSSPGMTRAQIYKTQQIMSPNEFPQLISKAVDASIDSQGIREQLETGTGGLGKLINEIKDKRPGHVADLSLWPKVTSWLVNHDADFKQLAKIRQALSLAISRGKEARIDKEGLRGEDPYGTKLYSGLGDTVKEFLPFINTAEKLVEHVLGTKANRSRKETLEYYAAQVAGVTKPRHVAANPDVASKLIRAGAADVTLGVMKAGPIVTKAYKANLVKDLYKAYIDSGLGKEYKRGSVAPQYMRYSEVGNKGIWLRKDLVPELEQAFKPRSQLEDTSTLGYLMNLATDVQLVGLTDAVFHTANMLASLSYSLGKGGDFQDLALNLPVVGTIDAAARVLKQVYPVIVESPAIQAELVRISELGALRGKEEAQRWGLGKVITVLDRAGRLARNRMFDNLVKRNILKDTDLNRREFINKMGQYNERLMSSMQASARSMWSPFVVAGTTFNRNAIQNFLLSKAGEAVNPQAALKMRLLNGAAFFSAMIAVPISANMAITGTPWGRPGTDPGKIDLGYDDKDGRHIQFDPNQLNLLRRGFRNLGGQALVRGLDEGKKAKDIGYDMVKDVLMGIARPFAGPPVRAAVTAFTGKTIEGYQVAKDPNSVESRLAATVSQLNPMYSAIQEGRQTEEGPIKHSIDRLTSAFGFPEKGRYPRHEEILAKEQGKSVEDMEFGDRIIAEEEHEAKAPKLSPEATARAAEKAVGANIKRGTEVQKTLEKKDQQWLESRKLILPGFDNKLVVDKIKVYLTPAEMERYTSLIKDSYTDAISVLRDEYDDLDSEAQKAFYSELMTTAKKQAREQLEAELAEGVGPKKKKKRFSIFGPN